MNIEKDYISIQIVKIFNDIKKVASAILDQPREKTFTLIHHNDADGLTSNSLISSALRNQKYKTQSFCLERLYRATSRKILDSTNGPIIIMDLGSEKEEHIRQLNNGKRLIINIDHHGNISEKLLHEQNPIRNNFANINCNFYGFDGDKFCSSSSLAYYLAYNIDPKMKDFGHWAVIGSIGDKNHLQGTTKGKFDLGLDFMVVKESQRIRFEEGYYNLNWGQENFELVDSVAMDLTLLGSIGYSRKGRDLFGEETDTPEIISSDLVTEFLQKGRTKRIKKSLAYLRKIREAGYKKVIEKLKKGEFITEKDLIYFNSDDFFSGMGVKTIGSCCAHLLDEKTINSHGLNFLDPAKYIVGAQKMEPIPWLKGELDIFPGIDMLKLSLRTSEELKTAISKSKKPKIYKLISKINPLFADSCHNARGATIVPSEEITSFLDSLQEEIEKYKN